MTWTLQNMSNVKALIEPRKQKIPNWDRTLEIGDIVFWSQNLNLFRIEEIKPRFIDRWEVNQYKANIGDELPPRLFVVKICQKFGRVSKGAWKQEFSAE